MSRITQAVQLAEHVSAMVSNGIPPSARARVVALIADTLSVAVSGSIDRDVSAIRDIVHAGQGPSTVIGSRAGAAPAVAALTNALPVAAEQRQDGHRLARGHPAAHVVPAVLAVSEAAQLTGDATIAAVLTGCEVGIRVGIAMGGTPDGVHDIGTWGTIGAAAGVACAETDGDRKAIGAAIDIAATQPVLASARMVFEGYSASHLLLGAAAERGVIFGGSAARGTTAPPGSLERHFAQYAARRWRAIVRDSRWTVLDGYVKLHPTCAHLHGVNDAVDRIARGTGRRASEIAGVEVRTYGGAAEFDDPAPRNGMAARFSIPWTVAAGLVFGTLDNRAFSSTTLADRDVGALAARVRVRHDVALDRGYPAGRPATVVVTLGDGSQLHAHVDLPRGDGAQALDDDDVRFKPRRLLRRCCSVRAADALLSAVAQLGASPIYGLSAALRDAGCDAATRAIDPAQPGVRHR